MTQAIALRPSQEIRRGVEISSFADCITLAHHIHKAGMCPSSFKSPEQLAMAIVAGYEAGLTLTQSYRDIYLVNNRPTLYGDAVKALVLRSGLCEQMTVKMSGEGDSATAVATVRRKGISEPFEQRYTVAMAKKAGLWGKAGPWTNHPARMLQWRALTWAIRDGFADVLAGLAVEGDSDTEDAVSVVDDTAEVAVPKALPSAKDAIAAAIAGEQDQDAGGDAGVPEPKPLGKGHANAEPPADWEPGKDA